MSEIDDIFASKRKSTVSPPSSSAEKIQKKSKQKKRDASAVVKKSASEGDLTALPRPTVPEKSLTKRPAPETVVDTSIPLKKPKFDRTKPERMVKRTPPSKATKPEKRIEEDNAKFADSRGSGSRRKTEEGWSIYKEDELGISAEGGDTPLCPFDCDCCF